MRRILQPESTSTPHVTLRYTSTKAASASIETLYSNISVPDLSLVEPATFDRYGSLSDQISTLVVRCEAPSLEYLSYRPAFSDSFFHLTLYDGSPSALAASALDVLRSFAWNLEFVEAGTVEYYGTHQQLLLSGAPAITRAAASLLEEIGLEREDLLHLDDGQRLELIRSIATLIHKSPEVEPAPLVEHAYAALEPNANGSIELVQEGLWPLHESLVDSADAIRQIARATGTVLTPPELGLDAVDAALKYFGERGVVRFLDPAIGTGLLYAAVSARLGGRVARAVGYESDRKRANDTARRWRHHPVTVVAGDFIDASAGDEAQYDLVVANPPYLRYERLPRRLTVGTRQSLERDLNLTIPPKANHYLYFVLAAHRLMADGAVAAWILPAEFLSTHYGAALRRYLKHNVTLLQVHAFEADEVMFDNARVRPSIAVFRNSRPVPGDVAIFTEGASTSDPTVATRVLVSELSDAEGWSAVARFGAESAVGTGIALGDLFTIRRGMATGGNSFFILSDAMVEGLQVPPEYLRPILPKARFLPGGVIYPRTDGSPMADPRQWLIDVDDELPIVRDKSPEFADYLESAPTKVIDSVLVSRRRRPFKQESVAPPMFVFVAMSRAVGASEGESNKRFFFNDTAAVALNNYHLIYPRAAVGDLLASGAIDELDLLSMLRSIGEDELLRFGRQHSANLIKLEPSELRRVRVPIELSSMILSSADGTSGWNTWQG